MGQLKRHSLMESILNVASGFVISVIVWETVVKPVWNIQTTFSENLSITCLFTVISIARGYLWRRLGNWYSHRSV